MDTNVYKKLYKELGYKWCIYKYKMDANGVEEACIQWCTRWDTNGVQGVCMQIRNTDQVFLSLQPSLCCQVLV